jgi:tetratricopeptide (TPR) repeat protein
MLCTTMVVLASATAAVAQVRGEIRTRDGRRLLGMIRWQPASRNYMITYGSPPISVKVSAREVATVRVQEPENIGKAINLVKTRRYSEAIPILEAIKDNSTMLQWDVEAARWLGEAYLRTDQAPKAIALCEMVRERKPENLYSGALPRIYWDALREEDREATLRKVLDEAVQQGTRETAAMAQVMRGDIERKNGNFEEALVDGYLRVVVMFKDEEAVRPEALYKAVKCFEQLGQLANAEKMRKQLLTDYPGSPYAERVQAGT